LITQQNNLKKIPGGFLFLGAIACQDYGTLIGYDGYD
jgi:hypothetical protein